MARQHAALTAVLPDKSTHRQIHWIETARVFACFLVVLCHCTENVWLDSAARAGVPLFFMLSGALLLPQKKGLGEFYASRFRRVGLPFLLWSLIYIPATKWAKVSSWAATGDIGSLAEQVSGIAERPAYMHLWYIYALIGIYLAVPFLDGIIKSKRHTEVFLVIWLVTLVAGFYRDINGITYFQGQAPWNEDIGMLYYFSGYMGYFVLGYYMVNFTPDGLSGRNMAACVACIAVGYCVTVAGTKIYYSTDPELFYNYLSLQVLAVSAGLFALLRNVRIPEGFARRIISDISSMSFGIYLVHALFVFFIVKKRMFAVPYDLGIFTDAVSAAAIMILSYLCVKTVSKIPYLKILAGF